MAKSATTRAKRPAKKPTTARATAKKTATKTTVRKAAVTNNKTKRFQLTAVGGGDFTASALLAEFFGTMLLVSAMVITSGNQLLIGFSLIAIAVAFMGISGVNFNPAVSFGLWATRRMSALKMVAYWVAQFLGALAAVVVLHLFAREGLSLSLGSFWSFDWSIFLLEMAGMVVFMFMFMAAVEQKQAVVAKATTMGLGFFIGLIIATGYLAQAAQSANASVTTTEQPRISKVSSATLNPAAALVITENDNSQSMQLTGQTDSNQPTPASRLTLETILGTLLGAAIGGHLFRLLNSQRKELVV
ncbi:MAG TPA: aquaporin [Candidatus Saccharimonadales bacterium]|nr:aquaporin [Candidatus Saccharimonadales bacterium]